MSGATRSSAPMRPDPGISFTCLPMFPHQEINARRDEPCEAVVVRADRSRVVVNWRWRRGTGGAGGPAFPFHPRAAADTYCLLQLREPGLYRLPVPLLSGVEIGPQLLFGSRHIAALLRDFRRG